MAMGDGILLAAAGVVVAMLVVSFHARRWTGVGLAAIGFVIAYILFFVFYVFVALSNVSPFSGPPNATRALYGPWIPVALPVVPAAICSLVLVAWIGDSRIFTRFISSAATYLRAAGATVVAAGAGYIAGSLLDWPHVDDVVSIALLMVLVAIASILGIADRSVVTGGALLVIAFPLWFFGVIVARWSALLPAVAMQLWMGMR